MTAMHSKVKTDSLQNCRYCGARTGIGPHHVHWHFKEPANAPMKAFGPFCSRACSMKFDKQTASGLEVTSHPIYAVEELSATKARWTLVGIVLRGRTSGIEEIRLSAIPPPKATLRVLASSMPAERAAQPRPVLHVPDFAFERTSDPEDGRLFASVDLNGTPMHLEAIPVVEPDEADDHGMRTGADVMSESRLSVLEDEFGAHFRTTRIQGRPYVVVATPFGS